MHVPHKVEELGVTWLLRLRADTSYATAGCGAAVGMASDVKSFCYKKEQLQRYLHLAIHSFAQYSLCLYSVTRSMTGPLVLPSRLSALC